MAHSITLLAVFQSIFRKEMIRSLHVYGSMEEEEVLEREFRFEWRSIYVEMKTVPLFPPGGFRWPEISEGSIFDTWRCIFVFNSKSKHRRFPSLLCLSRNPKLQDIPNLANDLKFISEFKLKKLDHKQYNRAQDDEKFILRQDLNCLPDSETEYSESDGKIEMMKKKRAASKQIARLSLEDLSKYFGLPIVEASRSLNVGLTVLKRKCREFGIPRWPHRKIKSLDSLINDLQGEAERQRETNEEIAMAVAKRQKIIEIEKRVIEKKPFMEIKTETKRFRQDIFKKRHRASRAKKNHQEST